MTQKLSRFVPAIILALVILGGSFYLVTHNSPGVEQAATSPVFFDNNEGDSSPEVSKSPNRPTLNLSTNKTFSDRMFGITFEYPVGFELGGDFPNDGGVRLYKEGSDELVFTSGIRRSVDPASNDIPIYETLQTKGMYIYKWASDADNGSKSVSADIYPGYTGTGKAGSFSVTVYYDDNGHAYEFRKNRFYFKSKSDAMEFLDDFIVGLTIDASTFQKAVMARFGE